MRVMYLLVLTVALCCAPALSLGAERHTLERIVSVVDKDVITQGELFAEARLALVLREGQRAAFVPMDQGYVDAFVDHLISQVLVAQEARRMGADGASDVEVNARLAQLAAAFDGQDSYLRFLASLTMDTTFVRAVMARDVQNDRYIGQRLRTRLLAQGRERGRNDGSGAGATQDAQDASVDEHARARALQIWLLELRRAAQVRVLDERGLLHLERR